jgi:hypothetical protein
MGINKRYITKKSMIEAYRDRKEEGLKILIGKAECFILDEFSSKIFKDMREGKNISKYFNNVH